jgi:Flp pilus assembly protein TadD
MISLMLDYALGGGEKNLMPFHRTSLIFHAANTALIIVLLYLLFGQIWVAAGVGLLFGIHPMTVEPIPWVGERKTLLAAFFSLWSLILYVYPRVTSHKSRVTKFYIGSFVMYLLALMSKPTSTPLPAVMLLLDYWPLRRLSWRAVLEKVPFFVFGGISAIITVISQTRTGGSTMPSQFGPMRILLVLCHNIIFYLYKIIWPVNLSSHYPFPKPLNLSQPMVLAGVIGTFTLFILLALSLRRTRAALTGWLIFFVAIFPTMQIIGFSNVIASDKFAYLPSIGLLMVLAAFLVWLCTIRFPTHCRIVAAIILLLACAEAAATRRYLVYWQDTVGLFQHMLALTPNAVPVHNNLGMALYSRGRFDDAISHYRRALQLQPDDAKAYNNLGLALMAQGKVDEAISHYQQALRIRPDLVEAHNNLGIALALRNRLNEAIDQYRQALKIKPISAEVHNNLGTALQSSGNLDEAMVHYRLALRDMPDSVEVNNNMAWILATHPDQKLRDTGQAIVFAERAAELTKYKNTTVLNTLAAAYAAAGNEELANQIRRKMELYKQQAPGRKEIESR